MTGSRHDAQAHTPWLLLIAVAFAARVATFGNPMLHIDETFYLSFARMMLDGQMPYVDIWDRKPIGLILVYALPASLGMVAGTWAYQAMAFAAVVVTAGLIHRLARIAGWHAGASFAAIAYLLWINTLEGQGGQSPIFYNPLVALAVLLIVVPGKRRFLRGLAAMALIGVALQIKYSVVFEGLFFGLWLMWREWRLDRPLPEIVAKGAAWAGVSLLPTALACGVFAALGHGEAWLYANFISIGERMSDPWLEQAGNLAKIVLITSPLFALAFLGWKRGEPTPERNFLWSWLVAAVAGLLVFGSYFDHYALPVILPLALCTAAMKLTRRAGLTILLLAFIAGQITILERRTRRGTPDQHAAVVSAIGRGPGCLWVYAGPATLLTDTGRCSVTRFVFPSHLGRVREWGAIGADQQTEVERILADPRLEIVALRPAYFGERPEIRALVERRLAERFEHRAKLTLGNLWIDIYARKRTVPSRSAIRPA